MQAFSKSIPFLERPKNLPGDGSVPGDAGFDPLGFSDYYDLKWLREGEIKNGRVAMLAVLGSIFPEFAKFPQFKDFSSNPLEAFYQLSPAGWIQIFIFIGIVESFSYENIYYGNKEPGELGFDPLRLGANPTSLAYYKIAEIKNGRLAMIGVGGIVHQAILTKTGPITQIALRVERYTVQRSPHSDKKSQETFEQRTHKRLIDILDPTAKTVDELKKLNLPAGVDITIKI